MTGALVALLMLAEPDGGVPLPEYHVQLLPKGACLAEAAACMPPNEAVNFDQALRTDEDELRRLRTSVFALTSAGAAVTVALVAVSVAWAVKK